MNWCYRASRMKRVIERLIMESENSVIPPWRDGHADQFSDSPEALRKRVTSPHIKSLGSYKRAVPKWTLAFPRVAQEGAVLSGLPILSLKESST